MSSPNAPSTESDPTTNVSRMRRPSAVRTGMFCRFGSVEDSRPVRAMVWLNVVWMRPSSDSASSSPLTVTRSRVASRCSSRCSRNGCGFDSFSVCSASASVV